MNPRSKTNWTRLDEERFQEMAKLRDDILKKNRQPLIDLVRDMFAGMPKGEEDHVAFLEQNADRVRDALDPFDSGVRPEKVIDSVSPLPASMAPAASKYVDRTLVHTAVSRLKDIYSPEFCRFVVAELGQGKKIADLDPEYFDIIIRACDAYVDYHRVYPNVTGATFLEAAKNRMNAFLTEQRKQALLEIVMEGSEYKGLRMEQASGSYPAPKNFGEL